MPASSQSSHLQSDFSRTSDSEFDFDGPPVHDGQEKMKQLGVDLLGRWHWIALGLVLGILVGVYYLSKAPKIYQTRSTLLIKQQTKSVMARDVVEEIDFRSIEAMNTVAEQITRPALMLKVASRPEVRALPGLMPPTVDWVPAWMAKWINKKDSEQQAEGGVPPADTLASAITGWTEISVRKGTRLLDISVSHPRPEVAKAVADTIAVEYQAELTGDRSSGRSSSLQILVEEREAARLRLQAAQNAMANYQRALLTLKDLEARENAVTELQRRYLPKHPKMAAMQAERASMQHRFLNEFNSAIASSADREYWDSHLGEWNAAGSDEVTRLNIARRLLLARGNVLESEITSQTSVFNNVLTRIQEADINQQAIESPMDISSLAELPRIPVSPVVPKAMGIASFAGLSVGLALALMFVRMDNKFHTVAHVERETGLPALAAIADLNLKGLGSKSDIGPGAEARKRWHPLLVFRDGLSTTTFAEMFRVLRASVSLLGDEKKRRITLFSSALPGEGKTLVSTNFALAAANQGKRVLLIDLDLRKPAVHKGFGLKRDEHDGGVTEVLSGQMEFSDAIYKNTGAENLHLMLAGRPAPNPGELLTGETLEGFLKSALELYDLVVLDSAPLLAVPDTRIIAPLADNFCLVVRAEYVPKGAVRRVISMLGQDHRLPSGVVFNGYLEKRSLIGQNYSYGSYQTNKYGKAYRYGYGSYGSSYGSDEKQ